MTITTELNINDEAKTHTLKMVYKTRNGRREYREFPISTDQATDPMERATAISAATRWGDGHGGWRMVNWTIDQNQ